MDENTKTEENGTTPFPFKVGDIVRKNSNMKRYTIYKIEDDFVRFENSKVWSTQLKSGFIKNYSLVQEGDEVDAQKQITTTLSKSELIQLSVVLHAYGKSDDADSDYEDTAWELYEKLKDALNQTKD